MESEVPDGYLKEIKMSANEQMLIVIMLLLLFISMISTDKMYKVMEKRWTLKEEDEIKENDRQFTVYKNFMLGSFFAMALIVIYFPYLIK